MNILLWNNNFSSHVWELKTEYLLRLQWFQWVGKRPNRLRETSRHLSWRECSHSIQEAMDTVIKEDEWEMSFFFFIILYWYVLSKCFLTCFLKKYIIFFQEKFYFSSVQASHWVKVFSVFRLSLTLS